MIRVNLSLRVDLYIVSIITMAIGYTTDAAVSHLPVRKGCEGAAQDMSTDAIHLKLLAEPHDLFMAERGKFEVGVTASNRGTEVVDPELYRARLLINGRDSLVWSDAIGNGYREAKWFALPPGDSVSMIWTSMGESFFPRPGVYTLILRLSHIEAAPVVVRVRPS